MDKAEIKLHIEKRRQEKDKVLAAWNYIEELNQESSFSMDCFREMLARFSSKLAFIDKSIQDHKRLL